MAKLEAVLTKRPSVIDVKAADMLLTVEALESPGRLQGLALLTYPENGEQKSIRISPQTLLRAAKMVTAAMQEAMDLSHTCVLHGLHQDYDCPECALEDAKQIDAEMEARKPTIAEVPAAEEPF